MTSRRGTNNGICPAIQKPAMSIDHSIEQARIDEAEFLAIKQAIARVEAEAKASIAGEERAAAEKRLYKAAAGRCQIRLYGSTHGAIAHAVSRTARAA